MASTSACGIAFAAPIAALAVLLAMPRPAGAEQAPAPASGPAGAEQAPAPASGSIDITVQGIKSDRGVIRLAICPPNAGFPDCKGREVRSASLPIANGQAHARFADLAPGTYGISVFHDANGNGKLDTFLGIPREGYGFSRNPPFRPRAPRFDEVEITVSGDIRESVNLRYLL